MNVVKDPDNDQILCRLIGEHEKDLLRLCCVCLRDASLAQDAVQETFLRAYRALDGFRGESSERTWLVQIAVNVCRDMRRSAWFRYVDRRVAIEKLPLTTEGASDVSIALMTEIMRLPRREMEAVWLYYYEDMKLREIAQALGVTTSAVGIRLSRARERLRKALEGGEKNHA